MYSMNIRMGYIVIVALTVSVTVGMIINLFLKFEQNTKSSGN